MMGRKLTDGGGDTREKACFVFIKQVGNGEKSAEDENDRLKEKKLNRDNILVFGS